MIDRSKCEGCHLQDQEPVDTKTSGDNPGYMVVTEAPAAYNAQRGRLLSNNASKVLSRELASLGFDKDDFLFVPQIRCVFDPDTLPSKTKALIQKQCRAHLLDTIKEHRPDVIIPLGAEPSKQVHGRAVKITKVRGQAEYSAEHDSVVIPMLHPGYVAMYPQHYSVFKADCNTFARVVDNDLDIEAASNINAEDYHIITDLQFLIDMEPSLIFFDTETTGLEFFHKGPDNVRDYDPDINGREFDPSAAILTMQFCVKPGTAYMLVWDHPEKPISLRNKAKIKKQLVQLFGRKKTRVIGQNCVTPDTEVLTPEGWINIAEYDGQEIMQWCPDTDRLSFVTPSEYHVHDYSGTMHEWDSHMFSGCFTPNHKMFISKVGSKYDFHPAYAYSVGNVGANNTYVPLAGRYVPVSPLAVSENEARLIEAVRADGSVHKGYIRFHFSKSRKVTRIVDLLELLGMRYSLTTSKTGTTRLYVVQCDIARKIVSLLGTNKAYGPWVLDLSISSRLALLDEVQFWDATPHQQSTTGVGVYSASENDMSWLQILAHTTNHRMTYSGASNTRGWSKDDGYIYTGTLNRVPIAKVQYASDAVTYDGKVYCFTVPTGAFMMRRNGKVSITGNSKFDANFVFETLGIRYEIGGDTLMLAALLDENMISKGQDVLVKHYVAEKAGYADTFNSTYDKSRMWEVPLDAMIRYGCGDVDTGFMLYKVLIKKLLEDTLLTSQYRYVSLPGLNTFADVEVNGIEIDDDALQAFQILMEESVADQYRSLIAQVPRSIRKKHIDKGLAFSRPAFLLDILFEHRDGFRLRPKVFTKSTEKLQADMRVPSVSTKDHLPYFFEECPFTEELATYIKDERLLTTSVKGFNKKYIHDGLVRPTYALWVTVTGRTSSENPNGQNFPKRGPNAKAYRRIFIAPRGWVVIEADLSQAELRIAADMANEQTMLRIYREGGDIHKSTALIVMGVSLEEFLALPKEEQKAARQKAKAVNFGFIYGMGWRKFIGYAKTQYGVEFSEQEAQRIREAFFSLYSGLTRWHEAMRAWAREHGYVRSYSGRIRHLPMIYSDDEGVQQEAGRQAINSPVQNFASDLGVIAISRMRKAIDPAYLKPIAFVHDAIYCYAREEYAMWGAETIKYYMESNPLEVMFNRRMKVPIVADVSVGRNFGDTYELEGFTSADEFDVGTLWNEDEKSGILLPKQIAPYKNGARQQHIYCTT